MPPHPAAAGPAPTRHSHHHPRRHRLCRGRRRFSDPASAAASTCRPRPGSRCQVLSGFCQAAAAAILGAQLAFSLPGAAGLAPANSTDFVASWHHSGMRLWIITHSLHLPPSHQCSIDCRVRRFYLRCMDRPDIHAMLLFRFGRGRSEQSRTR